MTRTRMTNVMYLVKLFSVGLQGKKQDTRVGVGSFLLKTAKDTTCHWVVELAFTWVVCFCTLGSELTNEVEEVRHYALLLKLVQGMHH